MGLPTVRTTIVHRTILESLTKGHTYGLACAKAGISRSSFDLWRKESKEFAAQVEMAKSEAVESYHDVVHQSALKNVSDAKYMLERHPLTKEQFASNNTSQGPAVAVQINMTRDD